MGFKFFTYIWTVLTLALAVLVSVDVLSVPVRSGRKVKYRKKLWHSKPHVNYIYQNPVTKYKLSEIDVLALNRTELNKFIQTTGNCSFYFLSRNFTFNQRFRQRRESKLYSTSCHNTTDCHHVMPPYFVCDGGLGLCRDCLDICWPPDNDEGYLCRSCPSGYRALRNESLQAKPVRPQAMGGDSTASHLNTSRKTVPKFAIGLIVALAVILVIVGGIVARLIQVHVRKKFDQSQAERLLSDSEPVPPKQGNNDPGSTAKPLSGNAEPPASTTDSGVSTDSGSTGSEGTSEHLQKDISSKSSEDNSSTASENHYESYNHKQQHDDSPAKDEQMLPPVNHKEGSVSESMASPQSPPPAGSSTRIEDSEPPPMPSAISLGVPSLATHGSLTPASSTRDLQQPLSDQGGDTSRPTNLGSNVTRVVTAMPASDIYLTDSNPGRASASAGVYMSGDGGRHSDGSMEGEASAVVYVRGDAVSRDGNRGQHLEDNTEGFESQVPTDALPTPEESPAVSLNLESDARQGDDSGQQQYPDWVMNPPEFRMPDAVANPSWLPRRTAPDPVLTPAIRHLLNATRSVFYYSDSSGKLRINVKQETSDYSIQGLKQGLLHENVPPGNINISRAPRFVLGALPINITHVPANDTPSAALCGFYLKVWLKNADGSLSEHWWHCTSVYHLIHKVCRTNYPELTGCPWVSQFFKKYHVFEPFVTTLETAPVAVYLNTATPARPSKAVLDANPVNIAVEVADDNGEFARFYNNSYFTVDVLAVPADPGPHGWARYVDGLEARGEIHRLGVFQAILPCDALHEGRLLYAIKDGVTFYGTVVEALAQVDLALPHGNPNEEEDEFTYERLLKYRFEGWNPIVGDCGTPIYVFDGGVMKLVAFHVANQVGGFGLGIYVSHSIEAVFPQSIYRVEAWGDVPVDYDSAYYTGPPPDTMPSELVGSSSIHLTSEQFAEAASLCVITLDTSTSTYTPGGWYAVALQIEDFPRRTVSIGGASLSPSTPLSSVPLQFLIYTPRPSVACNAVPVWVADTPAAGSVLIAMAGSSVSIPVFVSSPNHPTYQVIRISVNGPAGMTSSPSSGVSSDVKGRAGT